MIPSLGRNLLWLWIGWSLSEGATLCMAQEAGIELNEFKEIKAKADKGEAAAQYDLGSRYFFGTEVPKNPVEAVMWFRMLLMLCVTHCRGWRSSRAARRLLRPDVVAPTSPFTHALKEAFG